MKPEKGIEEVIRKQKEKQLILKQDSRSSDRLLMTESELSKCSFH